MTISQTCSRCDNPRRINKIAPKRQRLCLECHRAHMREWRKTHRLGVDAKKKAVARSYIKQAVRRGHAQRGPCYVCDGPGQEAHHEDHSKPLEVTWLCRDHHLMVTWERLSLMFPGKHAVPTTGGSIQ